MSGAGQGPTAFSAAAVRERITPRRARELVARALTSGFSPADDSPRSNIAAGDGHLLLMPSTIGAWTGVKIASVAPGNPERGLPRIQATYLLLDTETLSTVAIIDGVSLTALRTPAVSAVAVDGLAAPDAERLVVFGTGPQAIEHAIAMADVRTLSSIRIVGRSPSKVDAACAELRGRGIAAEPGRAADVAEADIVVCATSAEHPLFDGTLVRDGACVVAMGSHEPGRRELDERLMGRSLVVVEEAGAALREAGDVIQAVDAGVLDASALVGIDALARGEVTRATDRPNVFKGTGMSWQDLAVAIGVVER
ncbi:ornithine cyclodeaminase family protein [Agrococcus sp. ARC_14]|uniref:ornithine cyclodeaminase family protein n=1 Tax=Agrococcus sp. ARC_14 TaxID=2919927 RepID=UPI001F067DBC|nr:ornithine cyclodeaminase family protein [Agrococcus sp. ARC_14]MCH1883885.1 ornithine cyclodeaminase family protein [Agrococcus sp. ARC_14]